MKMNSKFKSSILVISAFVLITAFIGIARFVHVKEVNHNEVYIPAESNYALKFEGKEVFKSSLHDLFLEHPDAEVFNLLRKFSKKDSDRMKIKDPGIKYLADILVFNYPTVNGEIFGFIFQLNDAKSFQKNILNEVSRNSGGVCNAETGILLIFTPTNENEVMSTRSLEKKALQFLNHPRKGTILSKIEPTTASFLDVEKLTEAKANSPFGKGKLSLNIAGALLKMDGQFNANSTLPQAAWTLKPEGFHISSSWINQSIQDSIQNQLKKQGFDLPKMKSVAVNYFGVQMGNGGIIPKMELLLEFDSIVHQSELLAPKKWRKLGFTISKNTDYEYALSNGSTQYILLFLDSKTVFIGQNKNNLQEKQNEFIFRMTGDARYLTKIEGGGLVAMGLNLYPPFKVSKDFLESLTKTDVAIYSKGKNTLIQGEVSFKEGKSVTVETIRLILKVNDL